MRVKLGDIRLRNVRQSAVCAIAPRLARFVRASAAFFARFVVRDCDLAFVHRRAAMGAMAIGVKQARTVRHIVSEPFWIITAPSDAESAVVSRNVLRAVPDTHDGQCPLNHTPAVVTTSGTAAVWFHTESIAWTPRNS